MQNDISISGILGHLKIDRLNEMQVASIEAIEKKGDVILVAPTGSGKTLAFLLPLVKKLDPQQKTVQTLILAPSRELALQIEQVFRSLGTNFKVNCCYGGHSMSIEKKNLSEPPAVLIGTPGRIADHIDRGNFDIGFIYNLVLDEFDKSLEFGFEKEMSFILRKVQSIRKRILTSATQSIEIPDFVGLRTPTRLNFSTDEEKAGNLSVKMVISEDRDKLVTLFKLICSLGGGSTLIFCNHKESVERVSHFLTGKSVVNEYFHGGLEQVDRESVLIRFRNGSNNILISTDLASRGLDIPEIKNIIHYHLPSKGDAFIHRNGRTARMNATGTTFIILSADEVLPDYIDPAPEGYHLPAEYDLPENPPWITLFIGAGKKDKVNKMDIVGFLLKAGRLDKEDLGLVDVKDNISYAAVKRDKADELLQLVSDQRIKNRKVKIQIAR
ncbi:MAG: DEAD/DEAH box helicase [Bacteroidales bacterium]|jgi:superfamily II DNA/RNA helicase